MCRIAAMFLLTVLAVGCNREPPPLPPGYKPPASTTSASAQKQIQASWVDAFDVDSTQGIGEGYELLQRLYDPRIPATDGFVRDNAFTYRGEDQVVYAVRRFGAPVHSVGAEGSWRQERPGDSDTTVALVICGNDKLITDMLHLVANRSTWALTVRHNNGEFAPVINGTFRPPLAVGQTYRFGLDAAETTATVTVPGFTKTVAVDTTGVLGPFAFWEQFLKPEQFPAGTVFDYRKLWATEDGQPTQPVS